MNLFAYWLKAHLSRGVHLLHILYPLSIGRSSVVAVRDLGHLPGTNLCVGKLPNEYRACSTDSRICWHIGWEGVVMCERMETCWDRVRESKNISNWKGPIWINHRKAAAHLEHKFKYD